MQECSKDIAEKHASHCVKPNGNAGVLDDSLVAQNHNLGHQRGVMKMTMSSTAFGGGKRRRRQTEEDEEELVFVATVASMIVSGSLRVDME